MNQVASGWPLFRLSSVIPSSALWCAQMESSFKPKQTTWEDGGEGHREVNLTQLEKKLQNLHDLVETRFEEHFKLLQASLKRSAKADDEDSQVESMYEESQEFEKDAQITNMMVATVNTEKSEADAEDRRHTKSLSMQTQAIKKGTGTTGTDWKKLAKEKLGQRTRRLLGLGESSAADGPGNGKRAAIVVHTKRPDEKIENQSNVRKWAGYIVYSPLFSYTITLLILLHVILLGVEVDLSAAVALEDMPSWFSTFNAVSVTCFVIELILKFVALGCTGFWYGSDAYWNIFDFVVIAVSVVDVVLDFWARLLSPSMSTGQLRLLRSIRFARALRSIRIVRLFRYIGALRTLALSILSTMVSLFWTLALLIIIFYSFGVVLTQLVVEHCRFLGMDSGADKVAPMSHCPGQLRKYWENVPESMLTLFMAISQGLNWEDAMEPLREVSALAVVLVILYVVITVFAILNVVTGVFLNTAIESAGADKDVATIRQVHAKAQQVEALQQIFREINRENDNEVNFEDVRNAMSSGELTLFMLLDSEHKGLIDLDEFVSGCMQLHGPAKSMQMAKMSYENKLTRQALQSLKKALA
eukprot:s3410_g6.t2